MANQYTTGTITVPAHTFAPGTSVTITGVGTAWDTNPLVQIGFGVWIAGGGYYIITNIASATSLTAVAVQPVNPGTYSYSIRFDLGELLGNLSQTAEAALTALNTTVAQANGGTIWDIARDLTSANAILQFLTGGVGKFRFRLDASDNLILERSTDGVVWSNVLSFANADGATVLNNLTIPASVKTALDTKAIVAVHRGYGAGGITSNTVNGVNSLFSNTTGESNTANGRNALFSNTTGDSNTANGHDALLSNTTGDSNTANGRNALFSNTTGDSNTANGRNALLSNTTGDSNTANGRNALLSNTTGDSNTANGHDALFSNTTGESNTVNGRNALFSNTTGDSNTANGHDALLYNTTGDSNTANGRNALRWTITGTNNETFSNCSGLGNNSRVSGSNQVQLGDSATTTYAFGAVQNRSDERDKADIQKDHLGPEFILRVAEEAVKSFRWDYRDDYLEHDEDGNLVAVPKDGSRKRNRLHSGVIAQILQRICDEMGVDFAGLQHHERAGGEDIYTVGYEEFIAPIMSTVLWLHNRMVETERKHEERFAALEARIDALEAAA